MHTSMGGGCQEGGPLCDGAAIEVTDHTCDMMLPENQMTGWDGGEEAPLRHRGTEAGVAVPETECGIGTGDLRGVTGDENRGHEGEGRAECFLCGEVGCDCESDVRGIGTPEGEEGTEWGIGPPGGVEAPEWGIGPPGECGRTGDCGVSHAGGSDGHGWGI